jgi:hypothetical protein
MPAWNAVPARKTVLLPPFRYELGLDVRTRCSHRNGLGHPAGSRNDPRRIAAACRRTNYRINPPAAGEEDAAVLETFWGTSKLVGSTYFHPKKSARPIMSN